MERTIVPGASTADQQNLPPLSFVREAHLVAAAGLLPARHACRLLAKSPDWNVPSGPERL
jgi:hypothetical protein